MRTADVPALAIQCDLDSAKVGASEVQSEVLTSLLARWKGSHIGRKHLHRRVILRARAHASGGARDKGRHPPIDGAKGPHFVQPQLHGQQHVRGNVIQVPAGQIKNTLNLFGDLCKWKQTKTVVRARDVQGGTKRLSHRTDGKVDFASFSHGLLERFNLLAVQPS